MNKKPPMIILLVILLIQPAIAGLSIPISAVNATSQAIPAQDPGYRINPADLIPHVPISINGTADFISQGWPGQGTEANPYLIEDLNITADVGFICIDIAYTDTYFVIRDCYVNQKSMLWGILLNTTAHGAIEYTTVDSMDIAICLSNANNTQVISSSITCNTHYGLLVGYSDACTVNGNYIDGVDEAVRIWSSTHTSLSDNEITGTSLTYGIYALFSNYTASTNDVITNAGTGIYSVFSHHMTISGTSMHSCGAGLSFNIEDNFTVRNVEVEALSGVGIYAIGCDYIEVTDSSVISAGSHGMHFFACENSTFEHNTISNAVGTGAFFEQCDNPVIEYFTVENVGLSGMDLRTCVNASLLGNTVKNADEYGYYISSSDFITFNYNNATNTMADSGVYADTCNNGSITNSHFSNIEGSGIELQDAANWTITDNTIDHGMSWGIFHGTGDSVVIARNTITQATGGIYVSSAENASVTDNHITDPSSNGWGIQVGSSFQAEILRNTVDGAYNGIMCSGSDNATIQANTIANSRNNGLDLENMAYALVKSNTITDVGVFGLYLSGVYTSEFIDNTLEGCGFFFNSFALSTFYHVMDGNSVNGLPVYYEPDTSGVDILASNYGQIILVNNSQMTVHDGSLEGASCGLEANTISNCDIWNLDTSNNGFGIVFMYSQNISVHDITHHGMGLSRGYAGIYSGFSTNVTVEDSELTDCGATYYGAFAGYLSNMLTISNSVLDHNVNGIWISGGADFLVSSNQISNTEQDAIYAGGSPDYLRVLNNNILNATNGIYSYNANNWTIMSNLIMYCSNAGIYFYGSGASNGNITLNTIENNYDGIYVYQGTSETITNNSIRWNERYGVYLYASTGTDVYYNIIALNRGGNGYDSRSGNYWDDNVALGNWWDDYTPPGAYAVDGNTQDRYPMQYAPALPIINQPEDIYYAENSVGNEITWYAFGSSLRNWQVKIDGSVWDGDAWNYNDIVVNIDGLAYGTHTVVITLWDVDQNSVTDTVTIHVYDGTPPTISNTPNTEAFVTGSGQTLSWKVSDLHPATYTAYLDGDAWKSGSWTSGTLNLNIDGMTAGEHTLVMTIYDIDGNQASDSVTVLVINDQVSPAIDSPGDFSYYVGSTGNVIVWNASDQYPSHYQVTSNGTVYTEGIWGGSRIIVNVDGFAPGTHTFQITVYDGSGNSAQDSVTVTVLQPATQPQPPTPPDIGTILLIAGVAGVIVVVVVVVYFLKKRR